jgi:hypothetical protein
MKVFFFQSKFVVCFESKIDRLIDELFDKIYVENIFLCLLFKGLFTCELEFTTGETKLTSHLFYLSYLFYLS